jgi:hypothetical protein
VVGLNVLQWLAEVWSSALRNSCRHGQHRRRWGRGGRGEAKGGMYSDALVSDAGGATDAAMERCAAGCWLLKPQQCRRRVAEWSVGGVLRAGMWEWCWPSSAVLCMWMAVLPCYVMHSCKAMQLCDGCAALLGRVGRGWSAIYAAAGADVVHNICRTWCGHWVLTFCLKG